MHGRRPSGLPHSPSPVRVMGLAADHTQIHDLGLFPRSSNHARIMWLAPGNDDDAARRSSSLDGDGVVPSQEDVSRRDEYTVPTRDESNKALSAR